MSTIERFLKLPPDHRRLIVEASRCLLLARWRTTTVPFNRIAAGLKNHPRQNDTPPTPAVRADIHQISTAVNQASRHLPLKLQCLQQALAAREMLDRRNIASTLFLGTRRDRNGQLQAHAWLRSGGIDVTGGDGERQHAVLSRYP